MNHRDQTILFIDGDVARKYAAHSGFRWASMQAAMNLMWQRGGTVIVETGCQREPNDWGAGCSTLLFAELAHASGGDIHVHSVDNTAKHLAVSMEILVSEGRESHVTQHCSDSVAFFLSSQRPPGHQIDWIDLLYLDSYDYPYFEMVNLYVDITPGLDRTTEDTAKAMATLRGMSTQEVLNRHGPMVSACQQHCLAELNAALPSLHDKSVILIDDNDLAGGGKSRLAKVKLMDLGWHCLIDAQQALWIKS